MNLEQTAKLLTVVAVIDSRTVTDQAVEVWHEVLANITLDDAHLALSEFRKTKPGVYLEPGHLYQIARNARLAAQISDRGIARPPAPDGKRYAVDAIEQNGLEA